MLSLRLRLADLGRGPWRWEGDRWVCGASWIRPLAHPVLESSLTRRQGHRACAVVREATKGFRSAACSEQSCVYSASGDAPAEELPSEAGEYLHVELGQGWVRITAGPYGTAPLYLAADADMLEGSWWLPDLRHHMSEKRLLDRVVVRALARHHRYGIDTLFADVHRLTERATATFAASGLRIEYPPPALHVSQPRRLRTGADPIAALDKLLAATVGRLAVPSEMVGVELSGGADSANVALAVAAAHEGRVGSYGLLFAGNVGTHQQYRRSELVTRLGLHDVPVAAAQYPPFVPDGPRAHGVAHDPPGDFYHEAFDAAHRTARANGMQVVFTGFGGDEITALRPAERDTPLPTSGEVPWLDTRARQARTEIDTNTAQVSFVPLPSLMAFTARNPLMLRHGLWPVSPLADPAVVRFAESLPLEWRRHKRLLRHRLQHAGFGEDITHPAQPENFLSLMQAGLRHHGLPLMGRMLDDSLLVDAGYVDRNALAAAYRQAQTAGEIPDLLHDTIAIEVGLRSLLNRNGQPLWT